MGGMEVAALLLLSVYCYIIIKKWFLNANELVMLLTACIMLLSLLLGGKWAIFTYLLVVGYHNYMVWQAARITRLFRRAETFAEDRRTVFSGCIEKCFMVSENQIKLAIYLLYFWIVIRAASLKSLSADVGHGILLEVGGGWNCLLFDWSAIYGVWLTFSVLGALACWYLLLHDNQAETLYKKYLLRDKLIFDGVVGTVVLGYQLWAHSRSRCLLDCVLLYEAGGLVHWVWFLGLPCSTLWFFVRKQGVFEERGTSQTQGQTDQEKELNEQIIDREYQERVNAYRQP